MKHIKKHSIGSMSSMLVSIPGLIVFFCFTVIASVFHQALIAGFCSFILLLCGVSRLWGHFSIRKVSVSIDALSVRMFAGDETDICFTIENQKLMPLIWLELLIPMPRRSCVNTDGFREADAAVQDESLWEGKRALKKRFSFIKGKDSVSWRDRWIAARRGVYYLDRFILRSGDGFSLTHAQSIARPAETVILVVYPKVRQVDISQMLSVQWDSAGDNRGFIDDLTAMRGMRRYEEGDSWKRINWRMAARQQEMNVNLYETITPRAVHFIVDGESFCTIPEDDSEFEETLSMLASLIISLTDARVLCGLSLPHSKYMPQTDIAATADTTELLTAIAGYDMLAAREKEFVQEDQNVVFLPSNFNRPALARVSHQAGRLYYIARDAAGLRSNGLPQDLDNTKLIALFYREASDEDADTLGVRIMRLQSFGR